MFLVEPESGQRCHYSSPRALGAAIRRGELGPQARIFHQASNQWLPITVHPEYHRAEEEWEQSSVHRLRHRGWTFFPGASDGPPQDDPLLALAPPREPAPQVLIQGEREPSRWGSALQRILHLARPGAPERRQSHLR
jgi:hypothetical protein